MKNDRLGPIDPDDRVSLEVGGMVYSGWKDCQIKLSLEHLSGAFSVSVSERWAGSDQAWEIVPGDACQLFIGQIPVITGYVDSVSVSGSPTSHTIKIEGRDKTGDLVDCSAPAKEWKGSRFGEVCLELCKPFGIELLTQLDSDDAGFSSKKPTKAAAKKAKAAKSSGAGCGRKSTNTSETVHKVLEKLAKAQGVMLISDGEGNLVITRAGLGGRCDDMLVLGENVKDVEFTRDFKELYSEITIKGQATGASTGGKTLSGAEQTVTPAHTVKRAVSSTTSSNAEVLRYRPLIIAAEEQADKARCVRRAQWEAATREGKSKKLSVTVQGWRQSSGALWMINTVCRVDCPWVRVDEQDMLIVDVDRSIDLQGGTITKITLQPQAAFELLPELPDPGDGSGKKKASGRGVQKLSGAR